MTDLSALLSNESVRDLLNMNHNETMDITIHGCQFTVMKREFMDKMLNAGIITRDKLERKEP